MGKIEDEQVLMRIFIGQLDRWKQKPLYKALIELFRAKGLAGATVLQGVAGFGPEATLHEARLFRLSQDLPLIIEVVDTEDHVRTVLPEVDRMMNGGLITLEKVQAVRYGREGK